MNMMTDGFMQNTLPTCNDETEHDIRLSNPVLVPLIYLERFSDLTGIPKDVLREKIDNDIIPTVVVGSHKMVDISRLDKYLPDRKEMAE